MCWGCESETITPQNTSLGLNYFPLAVGNYSLYNVEKVRYTFGKDPDSSCYQLKEVVADSFPGVGGEIVYRLERYRRESEEMVWEPDSVWTARKSIGRVVVVENNVPLIKLVFPLKADLKWDGNAINSRKEQVYMLEPTPEALIKEIEMPLNSLPGQSFTVIQEESSDTIINYIQKAEIYVEDIGLFYKKSVNLHYCATSPECVGLGILESGWRYRQTLIAYGKEQQ